MSETDAERAGRKGVAGGLDQLASILGAVAGATFAAGVIAPLVAVAAGTITIDGWRLTIIVTLAFFAGASLGVGAILLKARSKRLDDDVLAASRSRQKRLHQMPEAEDG